MCHLNMDSFYFRFIYEGNPLLPNALSALAYFMDLKETRQERSRLSLKAIEVAKLRLLALSWSYAFANRKAAA